MTDAATIKPFDRSEIIAGLEAKGERRSVSAQYADAFIEYRTASEQLAASQYIVKHPETGSPMENPYLHVRDRALLKLQRMRGVKSDWLW